MADSAERYKQLARALALLDILSQSRFGKTTEELRLDLIETLGLSSLSYKTVERDIRNLQGAGFHIDQHQSRSAERRNVWKLASNYKKIPDLQISVLELLSFSAGMDLLYPLVGTPFWQGIQMLWHKMKELVPESAWEHFRRQRSGLIVRGAVPKNYSDKEGMLSALNRAIHQHRVTEIDYQRTGQDHADRRAVAPHGVAIYHGALYVVATDPADERGPFKLFKVDRIARATVGDDRFKPRPDYAPESLFASSIGVFRGGEPQTFRVRIDKDCAPWALETPFHPNQRVEKAADGSVILLIESAYEAELLPRILSLGEHAELLDPPAARANLRAVVDQLARRYRS